MEASGSKPKTKIHKPGMSSRNFAANSNSQETSRNRVFVRRDSTPDILSFRYEKRTSEATKATEVPSYNLWKSRLDRRSSLPNCLAFGQKKNPTTSGHFVPSVLRRETKGIRKYSTSLGSTINENHEQTASEITSGNDGQDRNDVVTPNRIEVLPKEESWQQIFSRESSAIRQGSNSYCDSVSTIRCRSTEIPLAKRDKTRQLAYYAKNDSIKRWLNQVE